MRQKNRRIMAAGMAAVTLCTSLVSVPVYAAEASVSVDEAMYVNLDCYGSVDKVNVVKGVSLNGLTSFTDYGNYLDVTNMTNNTAPEISDGKVTWNLPADTKGYFYYKGAINKDAVTLPWTMDVSYKLNGVPTDAEKLAGASGLVEVHVTATPNETARDYYKNNMMLVVAMLVDMSKCYSVEAEGSQTQSLGSQTAIMYTALPGEEGDYTIRIGSDKFETSGVIMAMVPGTVKDLEHIVDLKDAKDTWKDAGDQLYDSMDQMAASVEAMRSGVNELRQGLNEAESARGVISGSKDEILDSNDQTLASLTALSEQLGTIVPYIQTAKDASEVAHNSMTDVVNTLGNMQEPIRRLDTSLRGLRDSSEGASGSIGNVVASVQLIKKLDTQLQQSVLEFIKNLASAQESMQDAIADYCNGEAGDEDTQALAAAAAGADTSAGHAGMLNAQELIGILKQKEKALRQVASSSNALVADTADMLDDVSNTSKYLAQTTDQMDYLIEDVKALKDSLDVYYPDLQSALDDSGELVNRTTDALNKSTDSLTLVQNTVRASADSLDAAAKDSIKGSLNVLDKSLSVLDSTSSMRKAGRTMKDTMDNEWNDMEDDNNFLNMDPNAEKVSFTSDENAEPNTLQIIMRTEEISVDDDAELLDAETAKADVNPLERMWNMLVQMVRAIIEIFKNR